MSKVFIEESTLFSIGDAIRAKAGTTDLIAPQSMGDAIINLPTGEGGGGGYVPTDEELCYQFDGVNDSITPNGCNGWLIREYGDRISLKLSATDTNVFHSYPLEDFNINPKNKTNAISLAMIFMNANNMKNITGSIVADGYSEVILYKANQAFHSCKNLRTINDNFLDPTVFKHKKNSTNNERQVFYCCYSLREIPDFFFKILTASTGEYAISSSATNSMYYQGFYYCFTLNKIENLPVVSLNSNATSNMFNETFNYCCNLHKLTFETNTDGTPKTATWTKQTIDLTKYVGYASGTSNMTNYNSGLLTDDLLPVDVSGATTKSPDYFYNLYTGDTLTTKYTICDFYAKYGHTEAVETINSLPDTSAAGGGNTIKFKGGQGYYTDFLKGRTDDYSTNSMISNLTEAEIAVATAKGWTVSLS